MAAPAIIEVALNESADKAINPHVPYTVDEVVVDAIAAARAGASIVHFHARHADGSQAPTDAAMCREIMERVRAECDVILYPTYFPGLPAESRMAHIWELVEGPTSAPLEFIDLVPSRHVGRVAADPRTGQFKPSPFGPGPSFPPDWERIHAAGCQPALGILDMSDLRYVIQAHRADAIPHLPVLLRFVMSQDMVWGFFATPSALDAQLSQIPDDFPFHGIVAPNFVSDGEAALELLRHAARRGLGVRVGVGDMAHAWPKASNADLVAQAIDVVQVAGREPATPGDVRKLFGMPPLA